MGEAERGPDVVRHVVGDRQAAISARAADQSRPAARARLRRDDVDEAVHGVAAVLGRARPLEELHLAGVFRARFEEAVDIGEARRAQAHAVLQEQEAPRPGPARQHGRADRREMLLARAAVDVHSRLRVERFGRMDEGERFGAVDDVDRLGTLGRAVDRVRHGHRVDALGAERRGVALVRPGLRQRTGWQYQQAGGEQENGTHGRARSLTRPAWPVCAPCAPNSPPEVPCARHRTA